MAGGEEGRAIVSKAERQASVKIVTRSNVKIENENVRIRLRFERFNRSNFDVFNSKSV